MKVIAPWLLYKTIHGLIQIIKYLITPVKIIKSFVERYIYFNIYLYTNKKYMRVSRKTMSRICNILYIYY